MADGPSELETERRGEVQVLRLNRPESANALNAALISKLGLALEAADADADVRVVVITGAGERAFCAGMDLDAFVKGDGADEDQKRGRAAYGHFTREGITKPVVCAANGTAVAGGFELLMACDLVVASSAARFGLPEVKRGLFAAGGGVFLSTRIPLAVALEITLTGGYIDAQRAFELGLVNRVVEPEQVMAEAIELAETIAANGPLAVQVTKRLVRAAATQPADDVWAAQAGVQSAVFSSEDAKEGSTAFLEKRKPSWTGR